MPLKWEDNTQGAPVHSGAFCFEDRTPPALRLVLWPHRSLPRRGFAWFILATWALLMLPLLMVIGTSVHWALLPFMLGTLALLWYFLERSYTDGRLTEVLSLWSDRVELVRTDPKGRMKDWHANPHWVKVTLYPEGPVENYLTLKGGGREVEIGAFLSKEERAELYPALLEALEQARGPGPRAPAPTLSG